MSLIDLTKDLQNFKWTNPSKIGNANNPQSFDLNGNIVTGEKTFDRPSKSALDGMESIFGPKFSNVGTRGSYGVTDYMDGTKQGRGFIPPGGPPKGFTVDMGKSEYVIGSTGYTLTPLSHTIAQMNSSLPYGVVPEQTINDIPISPGAWGDYNVPIANYSSTWTPEQISGNASNFDAIYDRTLSYIPNIPEPELPIFSQFMRGSGGLNRFDLTSPNFGSTPFTFIEDIPYVIPQTNLTGPTTSPFVPNLFNNTPKLEHAHSVDPISRLMSYPGLYVGSQGDINQTAPQPLYSTPDYGVFTGPVDAFNHTELRSRLYDVYQHHFQPTDVNFVNIPYGDNLFGEDEAWKGGSIHIGAQDPAPTIGGGVTYYGSLVPIISRSSIYRAADGTYQVPQSGHATIPPGVTTQYPSNIPTFDGTQITLANHSSTTYVADWTSPGTGAPFQPFPDETTIPSVGLGRTILPLMSPTWILPTGDTLGYWDYENGTSVTDGSPKFDLGGYGNYFGSQGVFPSRLPYVIPQHTSTGPEEFTIESFSDTPLIDDAHGSHFMTTPLAGYTSQWYTGTESDDTFTNPITTLTHNVSLITLTGHTSNTNIQTELNTDSIYNTGAHGSNFTTTPINAQSSIFASSVEGFFKHTVHQHGFPGITMKTMNESGDIIDGTPPTRDEVMYIPGTFAQSIHGGPIFGDSTNNIFKQFIDSDNSIGRIELNSPNYDPDGNNFFTHLDRVPYNLSGDGQYHKRAPFIIRDIGQRWGIDDGTNTDTGFIRGGVLASGERTIQDVIRIGKFLTTPSGITFLAKQAGLQLLNPRPETRLWNPLSVVGSLAPMVHVERHLSGFLGTGQSKYGSFDNPSGGDAFWKNTQGVSAVFGLIDEQLANWGYGQPTEGGFGSFNEAGQIANNLDDNVYNRYTTLTKGFLIDGQKFGEEASAGGGAWYERAWNFAKNAVPTGEDLGRTPAVPTQYVFSQRGAYGQGLAAKNTGYGTGEENRLGIAGEDGNPGLMFSPSYWRGKSGKPHWSDFQAYRSSDMIDYQSLSYHELHPYFSYMNAFRGADLSDSDTDFNNRGGNVNAGLDTKFYSPLIQFSWRFFNSDATKNFKGGVAGWHEDTQKLEDASTSYLDNSFTTDPKNSLVKKYGLMTYGEIPGVSGGTKYEDSSVYNNTFPLKQVKDLAATDLATLSTAMASARADAVAAINKMPAKPGVAKENIGSGQESQEWGEYEAARQNKKAKHAIYSEATAKYLEARDTHAKLVAVTMAELAASSKKASTDVGNQSVRGNTAVPDEELGMIHKPTGNYVGPNTDKVNMIPYGNDYGDTEDFIKFKFKDIINNKFIIFRALLSGISDTITPEWEATRFIGRPDDVHVYKGTSRKVSFSFDVYPKTKQEFPVILEKLNFLIGLNYPSFQNNRMVAPFIELTLGDMFNATPGYIDGVTITPQDNSTWEMDMGLQFPKHMQVQCDFTYIGKYMPSSLGKHYELPWLVDQGWTTEVDNKAASAGTFLLKGGAVTDEKMYPQRDKHKKLFDEIQPSV